jgi:polysaccharide biosynthesis PFTS motif protein
VVVPFSSAAYISSYLKKPAIFYDPTGSIVDNDAKEPLIEFINGRDCLADAMLSIIKQNILTH